MEPDLLLESIKERVRDKNIYELRQIARVVGVRRPAEGKRSRLITEIIKIASGEMEASPRSARGAPPKSNEYDRELVADIQSCVNYFSAVANGSALPHGCGVASGKGDKPCSGILLLDGRAGRLAAGCVPSAGDVFVHDSFITRFSLREGDFVEGCCALKDLQNGYGLTSVSKINGSCPDALARKNYCDLTPVYPNTRLTLTGSPFVRAAGLISPVGKGQRMVVPIGEEADKAECIMSIAHALSLNQGLKTALLLLDARPEDVTYFKRSLSGVNIFYTNFGADGQTCAQAVKTLSAHVKSLAECGSDAALIVDGSSAEQVKSLLAPAINAEEGGSVTVIAFVPQDSVGLGGLLRAANSRLYINGVRRGTECTSQIDLASSRTEKSGLLRASGEGEAISRLLDKSDGNYARFIDLLNQFPSDEELINNYKNG